MCYGRLDLAHHCFEGGGRGGDVTYMPSCCCFLINIDHREGLYGLIKTKDNIQGFYSE